MLTFTYSGGWYQGTDNLMRRCVFRASPTLNSIDSRAFTDSSSFAASSSTTPTVIQYGMTTTRIWRLTVQVLAVSQIKGIPLGPKSNALTINAEL